MLEKFFALFIVVFSQNAFAASVSIYDPVSEMLVPLTFTVSGDWFCEIGTALDKVVVTSEQVACGASNYGPPAGEFNANCTCKGATSDISVAANLYCTDLKTGKSALRSIASINTLSCFDDSTDFCCRTGDPNNMYVWTTQLQCIKNGGSAFEAERFKCPPKPVKADPAVPGK